MDTINSVVMYDTFMCIWFDSYINIYVEIRFKWLFLSKLVNFSENILFQEPSYYGPTFRDWDILKEIVH
jgi:hypothetical protein